MFCFDLGSIWFRVLVLVLVLVSVFCFLFVIYLFIFSILVVVSFLKPYYFCRRFFWGVWCRLWFSRLVPVSISVVGFEGALS